MAAVVRYPLCKLLWVGLLVAFELTEDVFCEFLILTSSEKAEIGHLSLTLAMADHGASWVEGLKIEFFFVLLEVA
jgi:hypothetical protein